MNYRVASIFTLLFTAALLYSADEISSVVVDDFLNVYEDENTQSFLGAASGIYFGEELAKTGNSNFINSPHVGGGWWSTWDDRSEGGSSVATNASGDTVTESTMSTLVEDGTLSVTFSIASSVDSIIDTTYDTLDIDVEPVEIDTVLDTITYDVFGYGGLTVPLAAKVTLTSESTVDDSDGYWDLSNLTALVLTYSLDRAMWCTFGTKDVEDAGLAWGSWGFFLQETGGEVVTDTILISEIVAEAYSPVADSAAAGWSWETSRISVSELGFNAEGEAGTTAATTLSLERVELLGMSYADFGIELIDVATSVQSSRTPTPQGAVVLRSLSTGVVGVTVPRSGLYTIELVGLNGRVISREKRSFAQGTLNRVSFPQASKGLYLIRVNGQSLSKAAAVTIR